MVKNGSLPEREIVIGAGAIAVTQSLVRDNSLDPEQQVTFKRQTSLMMLFKLPRSACKKWSRLNCLENIALVIERLPVKDGIMQKLKSA